MPATASVKIDPAFGAASLVEALSLHADDPSASNTAEAPDRVAPTALERVELSDGRLLAVLPAMSWSMVRLAAG